MTNGLNKMEDSTAEAHKHADDKHKHSALSLFEDAYSTPEAKKQAQAIHAAEFHTTWMGFVHSPEDDKVNALLKNMNTAELYQVEQQYQHIYGSKLTDDISHNLNNKADIKHDNDLLMAANVPYELGNNLRDVATKYIPDSLGADGKSQRQTFLDNVNAFVTRAVQTGMSKEEINSTFGAVQHLLEKGSSVPGLTSAHRINAALGIMGEVAAPGHTDQGFHNTCAASDIEDRMFALEPGKAATMISSIALTGKYTAEDGRTISVPLDRSTILPGTEEHDYPPQDGRRSYASQLFQVGVMNDLAQQPTHQGAQMVILNGQEAFLPSNFPKSPKVVPVTSFDQGSQSQTNTGEYWVGKNGSKIKFPGLSDSQIQSAYDDLTGNSTPFVIENKKQNEEYHDGASVEINSTNDLIKVVQARQASGQLPVTLAVDASKPPFNNPGEPGAPTGLNHVVDINGVSYRDGVPYLQVANSWGTPYDKAYPASEIYAASVS